MGWGSFGKKDKKKKGKAVVEEPEPEPTPIEAVEPADDNDWLNWGKKTDETKGKGTSISKAPVAPTPPTPLEIESVSDAVEDPKLDEVPPASLPLSSPSESRPRTLRSEAPLLSESVWHPILALSIRGAAPIKITTNNFYAKLTQTLRTVVFTIELPNELSDKPLQVMATIVDDSRTAMVESLNSYLDSKNILKGIQGQRKIEIKYGVGKNGHVDVSTLEETMWSQYLDYFCQYTRIPELTVEITDS
ncbi:hypothetical protein BJ875DRAFT_500952 [Amylocarpus encephaloides]|uniref:Uncharacterized protein n=1 Tax=Amylocarpus encephaloides TaxID=45428 RepID=A0A9P7Y6A9_9HELO|nr:hypothetical protein BJ875DRAFT_500952 [Amylocarpus encephaloides]